MGYSAISSGKLMIRVDILRCYHSDQTWDFEVLILNFFQGRDLTVLILNLSQGRDLEVLILNFPQGRDLKVLILNFPQGRNLKVLILNFLPETTRVASWTAAPSVIC